MRAEAPLTPTGPARVCTGGPWTQAGRQQGDRFPSCLPLYRCWTWASVSPLGNLRGGLGCLQDQNWRREGKGREEGPGQGQPVPLSFSQLPVLTSIPVTCLSQPRRL